MSETKTDCRTAAKNEQKHFCTCPVAQCENHPLNHAHGCDPCIKDNLAKGKMPACMFKAVNKDVSEAHDWTIKGFVDFYLQQTQKTR